jgi:hypothetical protein
VAGIALRTWSSRRSSEAVDEFAEVVPHGVAAPGNVLVETDEKQVVLEDVAGTTAASIMHQPRR